TLPRRMTRQGSAECGSCATTGNTTVARRLSTTQTPRAARSSTPDTAPSGRAELLKVRPCVHAGAKGPHPLQARPIGAPHAPVYGYGQAPPVGPDCRPCRVLAANARHGLPGHSNVCMQVASMRHDCGVPRHVVRCKGSSVETAATRWRTTMELHQARYFLAVASTLNFTRAAEQCNVTQPALTKGVQKLEQELGGQLIYRERQLTQLTDLGKEVLPMLERTLASAEAVRRRAREFQRKEVAPLKVGLAPSISASLVLDPIAETAKFVPGL